MFKHVNITCCVPDPPLIWQLTKCFEYQEVGRYITYVWFATSRGDKSIEIFLLQCILHLYRQILFWVAFHPQSPPSLPL